MKSLKKIFTLVISVLLICLIAVFSTNAATYFSDGNFKFAKNNDGTITIVAYELTTADMVVPESIFGDTVVAIDKSAFYNNTDIVTVTLPNTINTIGDHAFYSASNLQSVVVPKSCTYLGTSAFQGCTSLYSVTIEGSITEIKSQMFYKCSSLKSIELPSTVTSICSFAFSKCTDLTSIIIPESTTSIADNAFKDCTSLTIYGYADSYAQQFASKHNIPFVTLEEQPKYELGDVDLSGRVDINDATDIQRYAAELITFDELQLSLADVREDEVVNISDATAIQKLLVSK